MDTEIAWAMALRRLEGIGPVLFKRLVSAFGCPSKAFGVSRAALRRAEGVGLSETGAVVLETRLGREPVWPEIEREIETAHEAGVALLHWGGPDYPEPLSVLHDPPSLLYRAGRHRATDARAIAVVGTRRPTRYGQTQTVQIAGDMARAGLCVVSGMALGIDGLAHEAALEAGGRTVAVLGSGLGQIYPKEHEALYRRILDSGAVYSECPMHAPPEARNFPQRNRIISGLALGVLVIEAGEKSGSLITARTAAAQGREVYALPGNVSSPYSRGANRLIREGARLVEGAGDILEDMVPILGSGGPGALPAALPGASRPAPPPALVLAPEEKCVAELLGDDPIHRDGMAQRIGRGAAEISAILLQLELKGLAQPVGGGYYVAGK